MKFFTTPTQRKILRWYWKNHQAFGLEALLRKKIVRLPRLARFYLFRMEEKGQIVPIGIKDFEVQYIGSTSSKTEWRDIRAEKRFSIIISEDFGLKGLNAFERKKKSDLMIAAIKAKKAELKVRMENRE